MAGKVITLGVNFAVTGVTDAEKVESAIKGISRATKALNQQQKRAISDQGKKVPIAETKVADKKRELNVQKQISQAQDKNRQTTIDIQQMGKTNELREKNGISMAKERYLTRQLTAVQEKQNMVYDRTVLLMKEKGGAFRANYNAATEQIQKEEEMRIQTERTTAAQKQSNYTMKMKQRNMMMTSISMFVLTITITQTLTALQQLIGAETKAGKALGELTTMVKLALGPLQVYTAIQQMMIIQNKEMLRSMLPWLLALGSAILIYRGLSLEAGKMRAALWGVGAAMAVLFLWTKRRMFAEWKLGLMKAWTLAMSGPTGLMQVGLGTAGAIAAAGVIGAAAGALAPSFQTGPEQLHRIRRTGMAMVHQGETIGRPTRDEIHEGYGEGSITNIFNIQGDMDSELAKDIQMRSLSGQINTIGF